MINKILISFATCFMLLTPLTPSEAVTRNFNISEFQANLAIRIIFTSLLVTKPLDLNKVADFTINSGSFEKFEKAPTLVDLLMVQNLLNSMAKIGGNKEAGKTLFALGNIAGDEASRKLVKEMDDWGNVSTLPVVGAEGINQIIKNCDCDDDFKLAKYLINTNFNKSNQSNLNLFLVFQNQIDIQTDKQIQDQIGDTVKKTVDEIVTDQTTNPDLKNGACVGDSMVCP